MYEIRYRNTRRDESELFGEANYLEDAVAIAYQAQAAYEVTIRLHPNIGGFLFHFPDRMRGVGGWCYALHGEGIVTVKNMKIYSQGELKAIKEEGARDAIDSLTVGLGVYFDDLAKKLAVKYMRGWGEWSQDRLERMKEVRDSLLRILEEAYIQEDEEPF